MEKISNEEILNAINNSNSMSEACSKLNMHFSTFRGRAKKLNSYIPNQGLKDTSKPKDNTKSTKNSFLLNDILEGKFPQYQSRKLKIRLIETGILEDKCCKCGWDSKRPGDKYTTCELHHKNGNSKDHRLENIEILCPNCHSLTENFRFNNKSHKK